MRSTDEVRDVFRLDGYYLQMEDRGNWVVIDSHYLGSDHRESRAILEEMRRKHPGRRWRAVWIQTQKW